MSIISEILSRIKPLDQRKTDVRMIIAAKIADGLKLKKMSKSKLASLAGNKNPSQATRWLSGTTNFTIDTLVEIGDALEIEFFNLELTPKAQKSKVITLQVVEFQPFSFVAEPEFPYQIKKLQTQSKGEGVYDLSA